MPLGATLMAYIVAVQIEIQNRGSLEDIWPVLVIGVLAAAIVATPTTLTLTAVATTERWSDAQCPRRLARTSLDGAPHAHATRAIQLWNSERLLVDATRQRCWNQACYYSALVTLVTFACVVAVHLRARPIGLAPNLGVLLEGGAVPMTALVSATVAGFLRDTSRLLIRTASRDISSQTMALASRRLIVAGVSALGFGFLLAPTADLSSMDEKSRLAVAVTIGLATALFGQRALDGLTRRLGSAFGLAAAPRPPEEDLRCIDGLGEEDALRLSEEGIDSTHALAHASTPRLFFNTPFPLRRLCDWQDQAILIVRLGLQRARLWREQCEVRGAIDASRLAKSYIESANPDQREAIQRQLHLDSALATESLMQSIFADEGILRLSAFRNAVPEREPHAEEKP